MDRKKIRIRKADIGDTDVMESAAHFPLFLYGFHVLIMHGRKEWQEIKSKEFGGITCIAFL